MKKIKKILALALIAITVMAVAMPALAATYGVLNSNVRVWTDMTITSHHGSAAQNTKVQILSGSYRGPDGEMYVQVYIRNGTLEGTTGYVLRRTITGVDY